MCVCCKCIGAVVTKNKQQTRRTTKGKGSLDCWRRARARGGRTQAAAHVLFFGGGPSKIATSRSRFFLQHGGALVGEPQPVAERAHFTASWPDGGIDSTRAPVQGPIFAAGLVEASPRMGFTRECKRAHIKGSRRLVADTTDRQITGHNTPQSPRRLIFRVAPLYCFVVCPKSLCFICQALRLGLVCPS